MSNGEDLSLSSPAEVFADKLYFQNQLASYTFATGTFSWTVWEGQTFDFKEKRSSDQSRLFSSYFKCAVSFFFFK